MRRSSIATGARQGAAGDVGDEIVVAQPVRKLVVVIAAAERMMWRRDGSNRGSCASDRVGVFVGIVSTA